MTRFYDKPVWKKARRLQLSKQPLCVHCKITGNVVAATEVDHIIRISDGGSALSPDNLQSLCHRCHSIKTGREKHGLTVILKGCDENGQPLDPNHPWHQGGGIKNHEREASLQRCPLSRNVSRVLEKKLWEPEARKLSQQT